jgi:hypothetical protein
MTSKVERIPFYHWYEDPACLAELWRWLDESGAAPEDIPQFLEKPWHWQPQWDAMQGDPVRTR